MNLQFQPSHARKPFVALRFDIRSTGTHGPGWTAADPVALTIGVIVRSERAPALGLHLATAHLLAVDVVQPTECLQATAGRGMRASAGATSAPESPQLLSRSSDVAVDQSKHLVGLITILPVVLTLYFLYWLAVSTESVLGDLVRAVMPNEGFRPGMGVAAGLVVAFTVGLLMRTLVAQRLFAWGERIFYRLPLIRSVYQSLRDLLDYFSPARKKEFEQVVAVTVGETGMQVIGLVTQTGPDRLPAGIRRARQCARLLPDELQHRWLCRADAAQRSANPEHEPGRSHAFRLTAGVTGTARQSRTESS